ncbi:MAG TPA: endonuclease III [Spirochaetota bacterium]|jgi:endonuclease-3|nr:endonuclease III [Spirochaetota bacterium]HOQ12963.1 endonuclease III [Spirochaetota bacterium]
MNKDKKALSILAKLEKFYGKVSPDLHFENLYQLSIAVVLSAQTTDKQVNSVTPELFSKFPDFKTLASASISDIEKIIKSTGFYHTKAKNIVHLAREVVNQYNCLLPEKEEDLIKLPGVGRKSANVILSIGFGIPAIAVDTHVSRISQRLGLTEHTKPDHIESDLQKIIPKDKWLKTHLLFIKHGRVLCKARGPLCEQCPVSSLCSYSKSL